MQFKNFLTGHKAVANCKPVCLIQKSTGDSSDINPLQLPQKSSPPNTSDCAKWVSLEKKISMRSNSETTHYDLAYLSQLTVERIWDSFVFNSVCICNACTHKLLKLARLVMSRTQSLYLYLSFKPKNKTANLMTVVSTAICMLCWGTCFNDPHSHLQYFYMLWL